MRGILSSARLRRRLVWSGLFMLVAGGVAILVIAFPSPKPSPDAKISNIPGDVIKPSKPHAFKSRSEQVLAVARQFIATAVARRHVDTSWDIVTPSLKQGFTRKTWAKGTIPVPPFQVWLAKWRVSYSFVNEVDLQVALFAPPKTKVRPAVFDLTLRRFHRQGQSTWLVSSFLPTPSAGGDTGGATSPRNRLTLPGFSQKLQQPAARAGSIWWLLPGGILALLLVVLTGVGVRSWRGRAVYRAYMREHQSSSWRPS